MSEELLTCRQCNSPYAYPSGEVTYNCPECGYSWLVGNLGQKTGLLVKDANGNTLQDGDTVIVIKDLPVKGAPKPLKMGTKVKNIRLTEGDHNIACKIEGFGAMGLKSEFVRKA